jgi:hypothetical protein
MPATLSVSSWARSFCLVVSIAAASGCNQPFYEEPEAGTVASPDAGTPPAADAIRPGPADAAALGAEVAPRPDAEAASPADGAPPGAPGCPPGLMACGPACLDLANDVTNCGGCGTRCPGPTEGAGQAACTASRCRITCSGSTDTPCGSACVDTRTSALHCGGCDNRCDPNATCLAEAGAASCACNPGYAGSGTTCALRNECADGSHRCGGLGGSCTAGAPLGYGCTCINDFRSSGGPFPQCYKAGRYTLTNESESGAWAYHFMAGSPKNYNNFQDGDFYMSASGGVLKFWGNNCGMRGLQRVESDAPLLDVPIPQEAYDRYGVEVLVNATYVSRARLPDTKYYVVFRAISRAATTVVIDWVLVYRPDAIPPDDSQTGCPPL